MILLVIISCGPQGVLPVAGAPCECFGRLACEGKKPIRCWVNETMDLVWVPNGALTGECR